MDPSKEQDKAAGGRERRRVPLSNGGSATASVEIRPLGPRRKPYVYLRWKAGGRTCSRYVGPAEGRTKGDVLANAWKEVHRKGLLKRFL